MRKNYIFFGLNLTIDSCGDVFTQDRIVYAENQFSGYHKTVKGKKLSPAKNGKAGYYQIKFNNGGVAKAEYVHRLVWFAFNGGIPEGYEIEHKDNNKANNALNNIMLFTRAENMHKIIGEMKRRPNGQFQKLDRNMG